MGIRKYIPFMKSTEDVRVNPPTNGEVVTDENVEEDIVLSYPKVDPETYESLPDDVKLKWNPPKGDVIDPVEEIHQSLVATKDLEFSDEAVRTGYGWAQVLFTSGWPEVFNDGFLAKIFSNSTLNFDATMHLSPRDRERAQEDLQDKITDIQVEEEEMREKASRAEVRDIVAKRKRAEATYDLISQRGKGVFDLSLYFVNRAETKEGLRENLNSLKLLTEREPSNLDTVVPPRSQKKAMQSASPVGKDKLEKKSPVLSDGVGAGIPFVSSTVMEETGVDVGIQKFNGSPVVIDRFNRGSGYNILRFGDVGSGKSVNSKDHLLSELQKHSDINVVIADPLNGFDGVSAALNAKKIMVGGNVNINPLEIRETPDEVFEQMKRAKDDYSPYQSKIKSVMSFLDTFFALRNNDRLEDERRGVLEDALHKTYERKGIYPDPSTHSRESPTILDLIDVLSEMANMIDNEEYREEHTVSGSEEEAKQRAKAASNIIINFEPFTEGKELENLGKQTSDKIRIQDNKVTYLDLQQIEGSEGLGLMMQLLFDNIYELAKENDGRTIFIIDEARYIMKDTESLEFLETAVRHSRHYDLSIEFITQTADEFFDKPEAKAIAEQCSIIQLSRVSGMTPELGEKYFGLNTRQTEFIRNEAVQGDEGRGYSESLIGIQDKGWFPVRHEINDEKLKVIDFDPDEDDIEDIPGIEETSVSQSLDRVKRALGISQQQIDAESEETDSEKETGIEDMEEGEEYMTQEEREIRELLSNYDKTIIKEDEDIEDISKAEILRRVSNIDSNEETNNPELLDTEPEDKEE